MLKDPKSDVGQVRFERHHFTFYPCGLAKGLSTKHYTTPAPHLVIFQRLQDMVGISRSWVQVRGLEVATIGKQDIGHFSP